MVSLPVLLWLDSVVYVSAQLSSAPRTVRGTQDVFKNDEKRYVSRNSPWRFQNTSLMRVIILWFVVILVFTPFYVMLSIQEPSFFQAFHRCLLCCWSRSVGRAGSCFVGVISLISGVLKTCVLWGKLLKTFKNFIFELGGAKNLDPRVAECHTFWFSQNAHTTCGRYIFESVDHGAQTWLARPSD